MPQTLKRGLSLCRHNVGQIIGGRNFQVTLNTWMGCLDEYVTSNTQTFIDRYGIMRAIPSYSAFTAGVAAFEVTISIKRGLEVIGG